MRGHSGTLVDDDPVVCGGQYNGTINDGKCFHYERGTKNWKRVSLLKNFDNYYPNL